MDGQLRGLAHRPQYHLISQGAYAGWLSDPNGPIYANGRYHVFYQAATTAQMRAKPAPYHTPDPISWGHMSSTDLTHWVQHPMAITPAPPGSFEGDDVYSGAVVQDPSDGAVISFFACAAADARPPGRDNNAVCYARSIDANITNFTKYNGTHGSVVLYVPQAMGNASNELLPIAGSQFVFRNASGSNWLMMMGSMRRRDDSMAVLLFSSPDLAPTSQWRYLGPMFEDSGLAGGGWCPYFAPIDPTDPTTVMLAVNDFVGRGTLTAPHYRFTGGSPFSRLDGGLAHVSAAFVGKDPKKRSAIVMRWLIGAPSCAVIPGRRRTGGGGTPACDPKHVDDVQNAWGWVGVHSLPITVGVARGVVRNAAGLSYRVVEEVEGLRLPHTHRRTMAASAAVPDGRILWHPDVTGVALELRVNVTLPYSSAAKLGCHAGLVVRATADGAEQTTVALWASDDAELVINRTLASTAFNVSSPDMLQRLPLPSAMLGRTTELIVYVDHSVIEVFVGDVAIMSSRVYPSAANLADRVGTFLSPACPGLKMGALLSWSMADVYA